MMFAMSKLIKAAICPETYIWVDVTIIKETPKALLIMFDNKNAWLPKAWIIKTKRFPPSLRGTEGAEAISIKISQYHWALKF